MNGDWIRAFIAWHLDTEHPWDLALTMEATEGAIMADLEPLLWKLFEDTFGDTFDGDAFVGLRDILSRPLDTVQ